MSLMEMQSPPGVEPLIQRQRHWLGLPVIPGKKGTFDEVMGALPHFGRQPFAIASPNGDELGVNNYLDMVYRLPIRKSEKTVPLGVVSKNYRLLDHHQVLGAVQQSMINRAV
jgi:hypothetical protein